MTVARKVRVPGVLVSQPYSNGRPGYALTCIRFNRFCNAKAEPPTTSRSGAVQPLRPSPFHLSPDPHCRPLSPIDTNQIYNILIYLDKSPLSMPHYTCRAALVGWALPRRQSRPLPEVPPM